MLKVPPAMFIEPVFGFAGQFVAGSHLNTSRYLTDPVHRYSILDIKYDQSVPLTVVAEPVGSKTNHFLARSHLNTG